MHDQVESGSRGKMVKGQTHYEDRDAMPSAWLVFLQTYVKKKFCVFNESACFPW